eukprot:GDKI01015141.1.p1 GENE.GDKI01015141.1~~GDKI01015141.1.p1  ORF type:complete len:444 (+),score=65.03 GDKI01015141.1:138-1469(+)
MGGMISAGCTALNVCCTTMTVASCLASCVKVSSQTAKKLYFFLIAYSTLLALLLRYNSYEWFNGYFKYTSYVKFVYECNNSTEYPTQDAVEGCIRNQAVYRVAFSLTCMFVVQLLCTSCGKRLANDSHRWAFILRFIYVPLMFFVFSFVPNRVFEGYADACVYLCFIFILFQIISLIDFAYAWNTTWVNNFSETDNKGWLVGIVGASVGLIISSFTGVVLMYMNYTTTVSKWVISIGFVFSLLLGGLSVTPYCPHGTLLTSAVVFAYVTWTTWTALISNPDYRIVQDQVSRIVIGLIIAAVSVGYSAYSLANQPDLFHINDAEKSGGDGASEGGEEEERRDSVTPTDPETGLATPAGGVTRTVARRVKGDMSLGGIRYFHTIMLAFSFYFCMLCSNWRSAKYEEMGSGWEAFWVQVAGGWAVLLLYLWTLIAPALFPDRDFGH